MMQARLNPFHANASAMQAMLTISDRISESPLEHSLLELVKTRASQINGCAFCIHMHTHDARAAGETEDRLYLLNAWRESPLYNDRERAALAWTEALTVLARDGVSDDIYAELAAHFTPAEQVELTLAISVINSWNRINVGFRVPPAMTAAKQAKSA